MSQSNVTVHTGTVIDGVQHQAEVLMARHTPQEWPTLADGLDQWERLTKEQDAKDFEVPLHAIAMSKVTGGLYNAQKGDGTNNITPTHTALAHLMSYADNAPTACVENLEAYSPAIRAQMVQERLAKTAARSVFLRTAVKGVVGSEQSRVVRAVVTDKHSKDHGDDLMLIQKLRGLQAPGARIRVVKEWDYTHVEIVIPNKVVEVRKGVIIQARINVKNSETKGGSLEASVGSMNLVCINGMVGAGNGTTMSIRHVGNIQYKMLAALTTVIQLADEHLLEFSNAYKAELPIPRADAIGRIQKQYKLSDVTAASLNTLWDVDGDRGAGNTVAGLANALTRAAQARTVEQGLELEAIAGKVISKGLSAFL